MALRLLDAIIMIGLGAALLAPLLYALATLLGMQHKRVYPILRLKERDGLFSSVVECEGQWEDTRRHYELMPHAGADVI